MGCESYSSCSNKETFDFLKREVAALQEVVRKLRSTNEGLDDDKKYWMEQYQIAMAKSEAQEDAYLKVIRTLSGRY